MVDVATRTDSLSTGNVDKPNELTQTEKEKFLAYMMDKFGLTEEQANRMLANLSPEEVQTYLGLASGKDTITRDEAKKLWGLTDDEADILFGGSERIGIHTNPFGDAFLEFLMLSSAMQVDIKQLMSQVLETQVELGISAAEERLKGATVQFACAMLSAVITAGLGAANATIAKNSKTGHGNQWVGPIGASLITAPINASGEYGNANYQYEGAKDDIKAQEANALYQQLVSLYQTTTETEKEQTRGT